MLIGVRIDSEGSPRTRDGRCGALVRGGPGLSRRFVCEGDPKSDLDPFAWCQDACAGSWATYRGSSPAQDRCPGLPLVSQSTSVPRHAPCLRLWNMDASQTWYQSLSQEAHRCCGRTLHPQSWKEHLDHVLPPLRVTDRETETQGREWTWQIRDRSGAGTSLSQLGVQVVVGNVGKSLLASRRCGLEPARPLGQ